MVTGTVVDYQARPVAGAEVAIAENGGEWRTQLPDARLCAPVVRTDEQGSFAVQTNIEFLQDAFVVARKPGSALTWDMAPYDASSKASVRFRLVMEKPGAISGQVVDSHHEHRRRVLCASGWNI